MSHLYPLAATATDALKGAEFAALTRSEATRLADGKALSGLETDWLTLRVSEAEAAIAASETGAGVGFIQRYENASGEAVLAVTYWKLAGADGTAPERVLDTTLETPTQAMPAVQAEDRPSEEDHTDDLYFRAGRTKPRGRTKKPDPNQMDLFGGAKKD